ncbi:MAG: hypothetical protein ACOC0N_06165 [Chroococcales cyanobacterium]
MNVSELLSDLNQQGVQLWAEQDKLKVHSPKGILTPAIQNNLITYKTEILSFLQKKVPKSYPTPAGLSLQTIGKLIGGMSKPSFKECQSPIIDPREMAKQLTITFRPLPKRFKNKTILQFREDLKEKLQNYGVEVIPWEEATRDFSYEMTLPLIKLKKKINLRVVKEEINAVIDVERPKTFWQKVKTSCAEAIYRLYTRFLSQKNTPSFAQITQLTSWAEDHAIQRLENPTATQVISLTTIDKNFTNAKLAYQDKIAIGVNTLVRTFSEVVIGISEDKISILNMNLSDSLFPKDQLDSFLSKSLIPKVYVPIIPLPLSSFKTSQYHPQSSPYAVKLVNLSQELAKTDLFPSGFKLSQVINRKSHRDIVDSIVNGRTGISYGFVAYVEPPVYVGKREITQDEWEELLPVEGFDWEEVRQNNLGRRYLKTLIQGQPIYKQIPELWVVSSRSGSDKTHLNLEQDILRIGLKDGLSLQFPQSINPAEVDIKPSYDTYVMVAIALSAALYTPELVENGAPMIHFHGYPSKDWFKPSETYAGVDNPSVPCGTYESGVFNFLSVYNIAHQNSCNPILAALIEPDHGSNLIAVNEEYLLSRLEAGLQQKQIELGGKYFASLLERSAA